MAFSVLGILICLSTLVLVFQQRPQLIEGAESASQILLTSLRTTNNSLITTKETLSQLVTVLQATRASLQQLEGTVSDLNPLLDTTREVIGEDLRGVIEATQVSLVTAEESAKTVDRLLFALDSISFLTGVIYDPDLPLSESIAGISEELKPLPESFDELAEGISSAGQNLLLLSNEINKIDQSLGSMNGVLEEVETAIGRTQNVSARLETGLLGLQNSLPRRINRLTAAVVAILLWIMVVQIGLFFQGSEMAGVSFGENSQENIDHSNDESLQQQSEGSIAES